MAGSSQVARTKGMAVIQLNCLVFGDDPSHIFVIDIEDTKTVSTLKEVIKDKNKPYFDHVPTCCLDVYKVSIPTDPQLHDTYTTRLPTQR
jgi:hypothetical protein